MELALLVVLGLVLASIWAVSGLLVLFVLRWEDRVRADLTAALRAILEPPAEGQPSALAVYSDQVATLFAARIVQQIKTAAGGIASGVAKQDQAEALGQMATQSPWMALLAGLLPKRFRSALLSAPQWAGQLSMFTGGGGDNHDQGKASASVADRLKRQG